jgi:hypothetical protein
MVPTGPVPTPASTCPLRDLRQIDGAFVIEDAWLRARAGAHDINSGVRRLKWQSHPGTRGHNKNRTITITAIGALAAGLSVVACGTTTVTQPAVRRLRLRPQDHRLLTHQHGAAGSHPQAGSGRSVTNDGHANDSWSVGQKATINVGQDAYADEGINGPGTDAMSAYNQTQPGAHGAHGRQAPCRPRASARPAVD